LCSDTSRVLVVRSRTYGRSPDRAVGLVVSIDSALRRKLAAALGGIGMYLIVRLRSRTFRANVTWGLRQTGRRLTMIRTCSVSHPAPLSWPDVFRPVVFGVWGGRYTTADHSFAVERRRFLAIVAPRRTNRVRQGSRRYLRPVAHKFCFVAWLRVRPRFRWDYPPNL